MLGIPIAGILATKVSLRLPMLIASSICAINILYILTLLPESLETGKRKEKVELSEANAYGAWKMITRNPFIFLVALTHFCLNMALNGLQVHE